MTSDWATRPAEPQDVDLLIRNAHVFRADGSFTVGTVACLDGLVLAVDPENRSPTYRARETIDARGGIVHPGITDAHLHAPLFATRGVLDTRGPRDSYFHRYVSWFNEVDEETEHLSTIVACIEALEHGVTGFVEPGTAMEPDAVATAAIEVGVRCSVGDSFVWDRADFWMASAIERRPLAASSSDIGTQLWRNVATSRHPLITGHVAVYGSASASASLLEDAAQCAKENGSFLTLHQSPTNENAALDEKYFGKPTLEFMEDRGILADGLLLAHVNSLTEGEELALGRSATTVAWCPANAINWGTAPLSRLPRLMASGSRIALGSDLPKTWGLGDQVSLATIQARSVGVDLEPERLHDAAFSHVRRLLGCPKPGRGVESGTIADLVVRRPIGTDSDLLVHLAVAKAGTVERVVVNGELVYDETTTKVDAESVRVQLETRARGIAARL